MTERSQDVGASPRAAHASARFESFPSTCWSRLVGAEERDRELELGSLAQSYWRPVYGYVSRKWKLARDQALDATQDFFVWLLEQDFLDKASRERGSFRAFLKTALRNFLIDRDRRAKTIKAGGGRTHISLDVDDDELRTLEPSARGDATPEDVLDTLWRREIVERATDELETELREAGKELYFDVFTDYFLASENALDYQDLAEKYGISKTQVSNFLMHAKRRYRVHLRDTVMATVSDEEQLTDELAWLFRGVRT